MKEFVLHKELWLPAPLEKVFPFFALAQNLHTLTPPWLNFEILTPHSIEMRVGTLIDYKLRIRGIPIRWQSEITAWKEPNRFVDEQRRGPYRQWIHEHLFESRDGGTFCTDHVRYAVLGGTLVERLLVRPDIEKIFDYRAKVLLEIFK